MNWNRVLPVCVFIGALTLFANTAGAQYVQSNLVADRTGLGAPNIDPNLINPWGLTLCQIENHEGDAENQESRERAGDDSLFCVADAFAGVVTVYTHSGKKIPVTISIPPASVPLAPVGLPTGIVFNTTRDFVISENGKSGPAVLLFASFDGTISGWNPDVDATNAVIMVDNSTKAPFPASYQGLAIGRDSHGRNVIYAADTGFSPTFSNNEIDMFGGSFQPIGHFTDLNGTSGMTVYNVQNVHGKLYVTFAGFTSLAGGVVDVFDRDGNLLTPTHFAVSAPGGPLEAPWPIVLAPDDFGQFSNAILIGNEDDGHINAYDRETREFLGQLTDPQGNLLINTGLWGMVFVRAGQEDGRSNKLFIAAGLNNYADGVFAVISPVKDEDRGNGDALKKADPALLASPVEKQRTGRPHPPR